MCVRMQNGLRSSTVPEIKLRAPSRTLMRVGGLIQEGCDGQVTFSFVMMRISNHQILRYAEKPKARL